MASITDSLAQVGDLSVSFAPVPVGSLTDAELLGSQRSIAEVRRRLDALAASVAGEIAYRSRRELGQGGLARANGVRSAEDLIAKVTGTSRRDAHTLVKASELLPTSVPRPEAAPVPAWHQVIGGAVADATLSAEAAHIIRTRLAATGDRVSADALVEAARELVSEATALTLEELAARAARSRDELDATGIPAREGALRDARYLRVSPQLDGSTRLTAVLDPESAAIVVPVLDAATSPRRGGPRFVDPEAAARADDIVRDERSTEQLALDVFVELVKMGSRVDDGALLGERKPAVRILVTRADLDRRSGAAYFEGQTEAVSIATAERYICAGGAVPILFDGDGKVLNLGREQRLFSEKQRIAMAARDGGCLMCGAPPSWTEAHHIDHWDEHRGRTDVDDGVLLCRFCHLNLHNNRWRIRRSGGDYCLEAPDGDGILRRTPLPSRSPVHARLRNTA